MNGGSPNSNIGTGVPPRLPSDTGRTLVLALVLTLSVLMGAAMLYFFNPSQYGFYPVCHFYLTTGLTCTGCGSLRALHQLLNGNIVEALRLNALFVIGLSAGVCVAARFVWATIRRQPFRLALRTSWVWTFLAVALAFTVVRNLPVFAWLAP